MGDEHWTWFSRRQRIDFNLDALVISFRDRIPCFLRFFSFLLECVPFLLRSITCFRKKYKYNVSAPWNGNESASLVSSRAELHPNHTSLSYFSEKRTQINQLSVPGTLHLSLNHEKSQLSTLKTQHVIWRPYQHHVIQNHVHYLEPYQTSALMNVSQLQSRLSPISYILHPPIPSPSLPPGSTRTKWITWKGFSDNFLATICPNYYLFLLRKYGTNANW